MYRHAERLDRGEKELMECLFAINRAISFLNRFDAQHEASELSEQRDRIWKMGEAIFGWKD